MQVVPLRPEHVSALAAVYRQTTAEAAHCRFVPSVEHFGQALLHPARAGTSVLVAEVGGEAVGFAALLDTVAEDGAREVEVTALFTRQEAPGVALLDACIAHARGARRLLAFPDAHRHCPIPAYNAGWDGLSDRLSVTARVLVWRGFVPHYRELHLECTGARFPPAQAPAPADVMIVERNNAEGEFSLAAMLEDREVGVCLYRTLARISDHPDAARWGYLMWLHVDEPLRRHGIARHLLTRALRHLSEQGCDGCWLTTGADNWPAQPLYLALGFEIVDTSACFRKEVSGD